MKKITERFFTYFWCFVVLFSIGLSVYEKNWELAVWQAFALVLTLFLFQKDTIYEAMREVNLKSTQLIDSMMKELADTHKKLDAMKQEADKWQISNHKKESKKAKK